jgi:hypothetical protein
MIDKKQFSFPNPFLHPFPEKEGVKIPAVEEIAGHILRELSPGREKEAFGGILLEGDRELLRTVLEEAPEEEFSFPQGEPDALILEERLRRLAPALACPLPLREGFSSSMVGAAVLLGGFFGWLAALVLGSGTAGASLAGGALGAGAAFWMAEKYRSSPEKSPSRTFRLLAFLGKALTAPFVQSRNSSSQVDRNALELQLRELLTQRYAFYRLALRGEYLFESLRQKNMEEKEHSPGPLRRPSPRLWRSCFGLPGRRGLRTFLFRQMPGGACGKIFPDTGGRSFGISTGRWDIWSPGSPWWWSGVPSSTGEFFRRRGFFGGISTLREGASHDLQSSGGGFRHQHLALLFLSRR